MALLHLLHYYTYPLHSVRFHVLRTVFYFKGTAAFFPEGKFGAQGHPDLFLFGIDCQGEGAASDLARGGRHDHRYRKLRRGQRGIIFQLYVHGVKYPGMAYSGIKDRIVETLPGFPRERIMGTDGGPPAASRQE